MSLEIVGIEVFTAVVMKSVILWDMTPCSLSSFNRRFGGIYRLHLQGRRNKFSKTQQESRWQACWTYFYDPEDGGDMFFRKVGWNSTNYTTSYPRIWYSSDWWLFVHRLVQKGKAENISQSKLIFLYISLTLERLNSFQIIYTNPSVPHRKHIALPLQSPTD
jgi:hypothetical protein